MMGSDKPDLLLKILLQGSLGRFRFHSDFPSAASEIQALKPKVLPGLARNPWVARGQNQYDE
jgi:hypothetical protein